MANERCTWVTFDDDEDVVWSGQPRVAAVLKTAFLTGLLPIGAYFYSGLTAAGLAVLVAGGITGLTDISNNYGKHYGTTTNDTAPKQPGVTGDLDRLYNELQQANGALEDLLSR